MSRQSLGGTVSKPSGPTSDAARSVSSRPPPCATKARTTSAGSRPASVSPWIHTTSVSFTAAPNRSGS